MNKIIAALIGTLIVFTTIVGGYFLLVELSPIVNQTALYQFSRTEYQKYNLTEFVNYTIYVMQNDGCIECYAWTDRKSIYLLNSTLGHDDLYRTVKHEVGHIVEPKFLFWGLALPLFMMFMINIYFLINKRSGKIFMLATLSYLLFLYMVGGVFLSEFYAYWYSGDLFWFMTPIVYGLMFIMLIHIKRLEKKDENKIFIEKIRKHILGDQDGKRNDREISSEDVE